MSIRKLKAGRVPFADANTYVGDYGSIFWDEDLGTLKISDGSTPGGNRIVLNAEDINLAFGDFVADANNLSTVRPDEDLNLISNGTGKINLVGILHVHQTDGSTLSFYDNDPIFQVNSDGQVRMRVPTSDTLTGGVEIIGSSTGQVVPPINSGVMLHVTGQNNDASRIYNDAVNNLTAYVGRRYNGTYGSPTAVNENDILMRISAVGYASNGMPQYGSARISFIATQNYTATKQGGRLIFYTNPQDDITLTEVARMDSIDGVKAVKFTGPLTGNVTGNISGTAPAGILTGTTLASNVVSSSLTSVGTLTSLTVNGALTVNPANAAISLAPTGTGTITINPATTGSMSNTKITLPAGSASDYALKFTAGTILATPQAGVFGYDGTVFYGTPIGTQRGIISNKMTYILNANRVYTPGNANPASIFGYGATVTNGKRYAFKARFSASKTNGGNQTINFGFGGTATQSRLSYWWTSDVGGASFLQNSYNSTSPTFQTISSNLGAGAICSVFIEGLIDVGGAAAGTLIPQISWSGNPTEVTIYSHAFIEFWPLSNTGADTAVGNWA